MNTMNGLVAVKRVIDFNVKVRVKMDGTAVDTDHVKMSMNPFDEIALEEAIRLKEAGLLNTVIAVSIGTEASIETLRQALARGADQAILVIPNASSLSEPIHVAKILQFLVTAHEIQLVFLGKQAIDDDCNQTGQMLAGFLGWSQGTNISKIEKLERGNPGFVEILRETDGGLENLHLNLPTVLTADLRLNQPRYISLPNLMKAKTKPLEVIHLEDLMKQYHFDLKPHTQVTKVTQAITQRSGKKLDSVKELVEKLRFEAKVIP